jgi:hypothetical protein
VIVTRLSAGPRSRAAAALLELAPQRLHSVREAFRLQQSARKQRLLWLFYGEHNLFEEAAKCRQLMMDSLRQACQQWRLTLCVAT